MEEMGSWRDGGMEGRIEEKRGRESAMYCCAMVIVSHACVKCKAQCAVRAMHVQCAMRAMRVQCAAVQCEPYVCNEVVDEVHYVVVVF